MNRDAEVAGASEMIQLQEWVNQQRYWLILVVGLVAAATNQIGLNPMHPIAFSIVQSCVNMSITVSIGLIIALSFKVFYRMMPRMTSLILIALVDIGLFFASYLAATNPMSTWNALIALVVSFVIIGAIVFFVFVVRYTYLCRFSGSLM